jgi:DNA modification methylase
VGTLYLGDNLRVMRELEPGSFTLIYADPPFGANQDRRGSAGRYADSWGDVAAYVAWLRPRLERMRALLSPAGTLYLHLDRRSAHHARLLLDELFGARNFQNELIWHYTGGGRGARAFPHKHDNILVYHKGPGYKFNADCVREPYAPGSGYSRSGVTARSGKRYGPHPGGKLMDDVWDIPIVNPLSPERTGYPTQKPEELLRRIIAVSTDPDDLVLDPCSGSGTAAVVAERLGRRWVAIDSSSEGVELARARVEREGGRVEVCVAG